MSAQMVFVALLFSFFLFALVLLVSFTIIGEMNACKCDLMPTNFPHVLKE